MYLHALGEASQATRPPQSVDDAHEEAKLLLGKINLSVLRRYLLERCENHEHCLQDAITALTLDESGENASILESDLGASRRETRQRMVAEKLKVELNEAKAMHNALMVQNSSPNSARSRRSSPERHEHGVKLEHLPGTSAPGNDALLLRDIHLILAKSLNGGKGPKIRKNAVNFPGQEQTLFERCNPFADNDTVDPYVIASIVNYPDSQCNTAFLHDNAEYFVMTSKERNVLDMKVPPTFLTDGNDVGPVLQIVLNDFDWGPKDDDLIGWALIDLKKYFTGEEALVKTFPDANGVLKVEVMTGDGLSAGDLLVMIELLLPQSTPESVRSLVEEGTYSDCDGDAAIVRLTILEGKELCNPDAVTTLAASIPWGFALRIAAAATFLLLLSSMAVFGGIERQNFTNSVYVIVCTFTTVGYGDVSAYTEAGKILTSFIAFLGLALLSLDFVLVYGFLVAQRDIAEQQSFDTEYTLTEGGKELGGDVEEQIEYLIRETEESEAGNTGAITGVPVVAVNLEETETSKWPDWLNNANTRRCVTSGCKFLGVLIAGTVGFRFIERDHQFMEADGNPWATAFYWASITSATVGYGDVYPKTCGGKWFTIAYILISTVVVAEALGLPTDMLLQRMQAEGMNKVLATKIDRVMFQRMDHDGGGSISRDEYLRAMIINLGLVEQPVVDRLLAQFDSMDVQGKGEFTLADLSSHNEKRHEEELRSSELSSPRTPKSPLLSQASSTSSPPWSSKTLEVDVGGGQ